MQMTKIMTCIFPARGTIDKTQLILDRSGLALKACKLNNCLTLLQNVALFQFAHAYSFYTKNFSVLTKFSESLAKILSICKILQP